MSITNDVRVTVRVDKNLKEDAESLFEHLGLNMSVAFNDGVKKIAYLEAADGTKEYVNG